MFTMIESIVKNKAEINHALVELDKNYLFFQPFEIVALDKVFFSSNF